MNVDAICLDDQKKWDEFVLTHSPQALFQSWEWGEVQKVLGHKIDRIGYYQNGMLVAVAQAAEVHARRGSFLHVRHGPVFNGSVIGTVVEDLKERARRQKLLFIRMSPLLEDTEQNRNFFRSLGALPSPIHAMDGEHCWVLDLDKAINQILLEMRKTTRYEIRQAQKMGVEITLSSDLHGFERLYEETAKRHGFVRHTGISEEFEMWGKAGRARLYLARYRDELLASAIILDYNHQAIYHHSASIPSKVPVMPLLLWVAICDAKKRGRSIFNFWGIAPADSDRHPWQGITLFKKGFGGREVLYLHAWDFPVSPFYVLPYVVETVRKWRKGY